MTTRIDHAAEADICINSAHKNGEDYFLIQQAQVHATLALVEQQRIANLISLWALPNETKFDLLSEGEVDPNAADHSAATIIQGLGLS